MVKDSHTGMEHFFRPYTCASSNRSCISLLRISANILDTIRTLRMGTTSVKISLPQKIHFGPPICVLPRPQFYSKLSDLSNEALMSAPIR